LHWVLLVVSEEEQISSVECWLHTATVEKGKGDGIRGCHSR
jgi:hypothetical protein